MVNEAPCDSRAKLVDRMHGVKCTDAQLKNEPAASVRARNRRPIAWKNSKSPERATFVQFSGGEYAKVARWGDFRSGFGVADATKSPGRATLWIGSRARIQEGWVPSGR